MDRGRATSPRSGPDDKHFTLDLVDGRGPARAGGPPRRRRAPPRTAPCPPKGAPPPAARVPHRRRPPGQRRAQGAISVLKSSIPFVARVENRRPARGGVDGEDIENAKIRGPIRLRARGRAVTTEDYEQLAREAAPEVARVRAVAAGDGADAGLGAGARSSRRRCPSGAGSGSTSSCPTRTTLQKVTDRLEESRVIGTRAIVEPPVYRGITVVAKLQGAAARQPDAGSRRRRCRRCTSTSTRSPAAPRAPAGRSAGRSTPARSTRCSRRLRGTELVEDARLFGADPVTGQRGQQTPAARARDARAGVQLRAPGPGRGRRDARASTGLVSARTRWARRCRPSTRTTTFAQRLPGRARRRPRAGLQHARQLRLVPRPVPHARRLPRLARDAGSGSRSTRAGTSERRRDDRRPGGRAVPAARHRRRPGRAGRDPDRRDGRDRRERRRPAGPSIRAASCRDRRSRWSSCG